MAGGMLAALLEGLGEGLRAAREAYTRRRKDQAASLIPEADGTVERIERLTEPPPALAAAEGARAVTDTDDPDLRGS